MRGFSARPGEGSRLLLGVDRKKDPAVLNRAYNDPGGLNAAFNRNILNNVNRLAEGDFDPEKWVPHQFYGDAARPHRAVARKRRTPDGPG